MIQNFSELQKGDNFKFGNYHGDIEWRVLKKDSNSLLVISEYGLDCKPFDIEGKTNKWDFCSLKKWLNTDFFNEAFNSEEKRLIKDTIYGKVFLLNVKEARKYFKDVDARRCKPTQYALSQGAKTLNGNYCYWWLRSKGHYDNYAIYVYINGSVYHRGYFVDVINSVRPAMRLKI